MSMNSPKHVVSGGAAEGLPDGVKAQLPLSVLCLGVQLPCVEDGCLPCASQAPDCSLEALALCLSLGRHILAEVAPCMESRIHPVLASPDDQVLHSLLHMGSTCLSIEHADERALESGCPCMLCRSAMLIRILYCRCCKGLASCAHQCIKTSCTAPSNGVGPARFEVSAPLC